MRWWRIARSFVGTRVLIFVVIVLLGWLVWPTPYRYVHVGSQIIRINRIIGTAERLTGTGWISMTAPSPSPQPPDGLLPFDALSKLKGNAWLSSDHVSVALYNGSTWTISGVLIDVTVMDQGPTKINSCENKGAKGKGCVRWSREFRAEVNIAPLSTGNFSISIIDAENVADYAWDWNIAAASGHPSNVPEYSHHWFILPPDLVPPKSSK